MRFLSPAGHPSSPVAYPTRVGASHNPPRDRHLAVAPLTSLALDASPVRRKMPRSRLDVLGDRRVRRRELAGDPRLSARITRSNVPGEVCPGRIAADSRTVRLRNHFKSPTRLAHYNQQPTKTLPPSTPVPPRPVTAASASFRPGIRALPAPPPSHTHFLSGALRRAVGANPAARARGQVLDSFIFTTCRWSS